MHTGAFRPTVSMAGSVCPPRGRSLELNHGFSSAFTPSPTLKILGVRLFPNPGSAPAGYCNKLQSKTNTTRVVLPRVRVVIYSLLHETATVILPLSTLHEVLKFSTPS